MKSPPADNIYRTLGSAGPSGMTHLTIGVKMLICLAILIAYFILKD